MTPLTKLGLYWLVWRFKSKHYSLFSFLMHAVSFPINAFPKKNFLRSYHTFITINASNEGICVELWRKNNTTLPASTKHILRLTHQILFLMISVYVKKYFERKSILFIIIYAERILHKMHIFEETNVTQHNVNGIIKFITNKKLHLKQR